jgi:hypothetical protein
MQAKYPVFNLNQNYEWILLCYTINLSFIRIFKQILKPHCLITIASHKSANIPCLQVELLVGLQLN